VRPIAVGIVRRRNELLVMAVRNDDGGIKGWRPIGGTIEFGERAAEALRREFVEELGEPIGEPKLLSVIENLYSHYGAVGHEIIFVFETAFANEEAYRRGAFVFTDGGMSVDVSWVGIEHFQTGRAQLFPTGLLQCLA
jgi:8-oxo-dGTP pyrophosphatase MutT (NUDIX family)